MCKRTTSSLLFIAVVLGLLAGTACEYPGIPHPLAAQGRAGGLQDSQSFSDGNSPPKLEPESNASPSVVAPDAPPGEGKVTVRLEDFKLNPDQLTVKAGTVTFRLENAGRYTHDFSIEGPGVDEKAPKVGAGRTFEWEVSLKPGEYRISCPISNHADRGMTGTLTVVE